MFDAKKVIMQLLLERGLSLSDLAERLGIQTQSLRNKLNRGSFGLSDFEKMADILGCDIEVITRDTGKVFK